MPRKEALAMALTVALFAVGIVTTKYSQFVAIVLSVSAVLPLILFFQARRAGNHERLNAVQTRFEQIPTEISVMLRFEDGQASRASTTAPIDHLTERAFESACATAVKTIKSIRRVRRSFPNHIWKHPDAVSAWIAILLHLRLMESSFRDTLWPNSMPDQMSFLPNARAASIEACRKFNDLL
jgi:hypothetical protein